MLQGETSRTLFPSSHVWKQTAPGRVVSTELSLPCLWSKDCCSPKWGIRKTVHSSHFGPLGPILTAIHNIVFFWLLCYWSETEQKPVIEVSTYIMLGVGIFMLLGVGSCSFFFLILTFLTINLSLISYMYTMNTSLTLPHVSLICLLPTLCLFFFSTTVSPVSYHMWMGERPSSILFLK